MTAKVTTYFAKRGKCRKREGYTPLLDVASSSTRKRTAVFSTGGQAYVEEKIPESRKVGQQDWHILYEDDSEQDMTQQMSMLREEMAKLRQEREQNESELKQDVLELKRDMDSNAMILGDLYIRNVASEALLFALGGQSKAAGYCSRFRVLARKRDPRLRMLVKEFNANQVVPVAVTISTIATALDSVIDGRNSAAHNRSMADLQFKVSNALNLLQRHPSLQSKYSQEYMVLNNYSLIRQAFNIIARM